MIRQPATSALVPPPANPITAWIFSSIGKKTIVAVTGIFLVLFVIGHMLGNLQIFLGQHAINAYAAKLQALGPILWIIRLGLLTIVGLHIGFTVSLITDNAAASPQKYAAGNRLPATLFVRTMRYTGFLLLAFIVFHLAHFTLGMVQPAAFDLHDPEHLHDVYSMMILGFQNGPISVFYILSMGFLAFHLSHGIGSLFQTLGINNRKLRPVFAQGGQVIAWILFAGFSVIPFAVLTGCLTLPK
ncbi:MAG TPA: succinate dehydrogenase cytochrome b subunit [Chthoniobacterales bacterium]